MIECQSVCKGHCWIVFKKSFDSNRPITLYHKYTIDTTYYHKHWETWTVEKAVESIKSHDQYVLDNGEKIRWMKQKGSPKYGVI